MEDSLKLTDTQRRLLAVASQRDDRALERPSNLTGGVADKVTAKLLASGLVEEIQSRGSLPDSSKWANRFHAGTGCMPMISDKAHFR
jgi:hypothetical protein